MLNRMPTVLLSLAMILLCLPGCSTQETADSGSAAPVESEAASQSAESSPGNSAQAELLGEAGEEEDAGDMEAAETAYSGFEWKFDQPENQGMDGELLSALHTAVNGTQIYSVVTVRNGYIVDEYYRDGYDETSVFQLNSCSKSFTSALIGIAIDEGLIDGVDVPISEYFPQIIGTDKEEITIRHVLEHTSGFEWYEFTSATSFWEMNQSDHWVDYVLGRPMVATPGSTFSYTTGGTHLLAAILEQVTEESLFDYASKHIFAPLGMDSVHWRADPQGILDGGNGIEMTARDAAKFGQLFLNGGSWEDRQLVPASWVEQSTGIQVARDGNYGSYGYQWWIRPFAGYDTYYAMGAFGQFIVVVPELALVAVITSDRTGGTDTPYAYLSNYILAACS